jgi:GNAT superfamily N-acetyltransferase
VSKLRRGDRADLDWLIARQPPLYEQEYGWSDLFGENVRAGLAPFLAGYDEARDACWVAEHAGRRVGAVAVQHDGEAAKLRWFFVEPEARGHGLGGQLLAQALDFCRSVGYSKVYLWTVDELTAARRLYEHHGFVLTEESKCPWAPWARQQRWDLPLTPRSPRT